MRAFGLGTCLGLGLTSGLTLSDRVTQSARAHANSVSAHSKLTDTRPSGISDATSRGIPEGTEDDIGLELSPGTRLQARQSAREARASRAMKVTPLVDSDPGTPVRALTGRRIALSAGHGLKWYTDQWGYQREIIDGVREDTHTNQITIEFIAPALERAGAEVLTVRERNYPSPEFIGDNDAVTSDADGSTIYAETGAWSKGGGEGWNGGTYRFANANAAGDRSASWSFELPAPGYYPIYVYFLSGANRSANVEYIIDHYDGESLRSLDQSRLGSVASNSDNTAPVDWIPEAHANWHYLGTFPFAPDRMHRVTVRATGTSGKVAIADAIRVGSWESGVAISGTATGGKRWEDGAWAYLTGMNAPTWVRTEDVTARPLYAAWVGADAYFALHTNAGGQSGTSTWTWHPNQWVKEQDWSANFADTQLPPGTFNWAKAIHSRAVARLRANFDNDWVDVGHWGSNFGELRPLRTLWKDDVDAGAAKPLGIPATLMEAAYHDGADNWALREQNWRRELARGVIAGMIHYFNGAGATVPPLPPAELSFTVEPNPEAGKRTVHLQWRAPTDNLEPKAKPVEYNVYLSPDGRLFQKNPSYTTSATEQRIPLATCDRLFAKVTALNSAGESLDSAVVGVQAGSKNRARILWVNGRDRIEVTAYDVSPVRDFSFVSNEVMRQELLSGFGFASADDEAIATGQVLLGAYDLVVWSLGETSSRDETLSPIQRNAIAQYLETGGRIILSGAELGWDLSEKGDADSRAFLADVLGVRYLNDASGSQRVFGSPNAALSSRAEFDFGLCESDSYCVDFSDVFAPEGAATQVMRYGNDDVPAGLSEQDLGAAILHSDKGQSLVIGFPLETITDPTERVQIHAEVMTLLAPDLFKGATSCVPGDDPVEGQGGDERPVPLPDPASGGTSNAGGSGEAGDEPVNDGCGCRLEAASTPTSRERGSVVGISAWALVALALSRAYRRRVSS
jgi:N-acetylmuramoyl-L-alanine amidase